MNDYPLPHDLEAERHILGACLMWPEKYDEVSDYLTADDFYMDAHVTMWHGITRLAAKGTRIDPVALTQDLRANGQLDMCGGPGGVNKLLDLPTAAGLRDKALLVAGLARVRRVTQEAARIASLGQNGEYGDIDEFVDQAEAQISAAAQGRRILEAVPMAETVKETIDWLSSLEAEKVAAFGVPTGFEQLDEWTCGFQGGDLVIIAAPPSTGKTALAIQIAMGSGVPALVCSLEQSRKQLALRLLAAESGLPMYRVRNPKYWGKDGVMYRVRNPKYWGKDGVGDIVNAASRLYDAPVHVDDRAQISPMQARSRARRLYRQVGLRLMIGDYLQIFRPSVMKKGQNRERDVADMSAEFKTLARELDIPVIILSQLNRQWGGRQDKRPILSDLRESGAIEQDADQVIFIYRPSRAEGVKYSEEPEAAEIILAKNRNGPCGTVQATWDPTRMRFEDTPFDGPSTPAPSDGMFVK
jgi:replicative DNA helicase